MVRVWFYARGEDSRAYLHGLCLVNVMIRATAGRRPYSPLTALEDPSTPEGARRVSIELRLLAFYN